MTDYFPFIVSKDFGVSIMIEGRVRLRVMVRVRV